MFQIKIAWNILIILLNALSVIILFAITVLEIQLIYVWNFVNVALEEDNIIYFIKEAKNILIQLDLLKIMQINLKIEILFI